MSRVHPLKHTVPIRPRVWWHVTGRKMFGRESPMIRNSWKVGTYPFPAGSRRR